MKFVTLNMQYGLGKDGKYDLSRTAEAVRGADVIALQEVERFWKRSGNVDQATALAAIFDDFHWVFAPGLDMDAGFRNDDGKLVNRRRQHGVMLLARRPIISSRVFPLPKWGTPVQHSLQLALLEGVIATDAGPIRIFTSKLCHLVPETRLPQIEFILDIHQRAASEGGAWCGGHSDPSSGWIEGDEPPMPRDLIWLGDMNFRPDSAEYDRIVGPASAHHGRINNRDGLFDAWVAAGHGETEGITRPGMTDPREPGRTFEARLDYAFVTPALADRVTSARVDTQSQASDHQPVWFELDLESPAPV
jgi:endonuclease/exonuclease/phosphatase family metal-dependent hydrolase